MLDSQMGPDRWFSKDLDALRPLYQLLTWYASVLKKAIASFKA